MTVDLFKTDHTSTLGGYRIRVVCKGGWVDWPIEYNGQIAYDAPARVSKRDKQRVTQVFYALLGKDQWAKWAIWNCTFEGSRPVYRLVRLTNEKHPTWGSYYDASIKHGYNLMHMVKDENFAIGGYYLKGNDMLLCLPIGKSPWDV